MWKLIKKAKRCLWWVIIRKTVRERESLFEYGPVCASAQDPEKTNLLLLFIFMNSCHLAQCEMMGHSCATRRAGAEFKITHHPALLPISTFQSSSPSSSPYCTCLDDLLNMDGGGGMGGESDGNAERVFLTEVVSVTSFLPKEMWHKN